MLFIFVTPQIARNPYFAEVSMEVNASQKLLTISNPPFGVEF